MNKSICANEPVFFKSGLNERLMDTIYHFIHFCIRCYLEFLFIELVSHTKKNSIQFDSRNELRSIRVVEGNVGMIS